MLSVIPDSIRNLWILKQVQDDKVLKTDIKSLALS